jgi:hypothetical protein
MTRRRRAIANWEALLACLVACFAAWHSPYLQLDAGLVLLGAAFAAPVFWRGRWSWAFVMRSAVAAYFFRCVAIWLLGSDAVRLLAFGDAAIGLLAAAVVHVGRCAIRTSVDPGGGNRNDGGSPQSAAGDSGTPEEEEAVWSPPQFTLRAALVVTVVWAGLLAVGVTAGLDAAKFVLICGLSWLLLAGCLRLIRG